MSNVVSSANQKLACRKLAQTLAEAPPASQLRTNRPGEHTATTLLRVIHGACFVQVAQVC